MVECLEGSGEHAAKLEKRDKDQCQLKRDYG
jgi:hypothetical protein